MTSELDRGRSFLHLAVVAGLLDDLWCHPVGRSDEGVALGHGVRQLRCHPKVRQLHLSRFCQQNVAALYVPVHLQGHCSCFQGLLMSIVDQKF